MLKGAGYKTACYGKWQLDGGDESIHAFGFDNYCVWNPYKKIKVGSKDKNPEIFTNGNFLPDSLVVNQYAEDIFTDSVLSFIDSNQSQPFFIYYPMVGADYYPFSPTPDDSDFADWSTYNIENEVSDTSYFKSMVTYMDKKIGEIINKVKSLGIEDNTVIIYSADNGTSHDIILIGDADTSQGGKGLTTEAGTHVPLMISWSGTITAGAINNDLIDFADLLPTLAGIANIPTPTDYGILDGVSFAPRLINQTGTPRDWIFNHFSHPHPQKNRKLNMPNQCL